MEPHRSILLAEENCLNEIKKSVDHAVKIKIDSCILIIVSQLYQYSGPVILRGFVYNLQNSISLMFAGKLGNYEMNAAAGLAHSFYNTFAYAWVASCNYGYIIIASQYFGARDFKGLGISYQRMILVHIFNLVFSWSFLLYSQSLMDSLGIESIIGNMATRYYSLLLMALVGVVIHHTTVHFLMSQNYFSFQFYIYAPLTLLHVGLNFVFNNFTALGLDGPPLSKAAVDAIGGLTVMIYVVSTKIIKKTWFPWSIETLTGFVSFVKVLLPFFLTIYMEWMTFEFLTILSSLLGALQIAIMSTYMNILMLVSMIHSGLGFTTSTLIGNAMGEGNPIKAQRLIVAGWWGMLFLMGTVALGHFFFRVAIAKLFSSDPLLIDGYVKGAWVISCFFLADGLSCMSSSILRAIRHEKFSLVLFSICYYAITFSMAYLIVFRFQIFPNAAGLWFSFLIGILIYNIFAAIKIISSDLNKQCEIVAKDLTKRKNGDEENC